MGVVVYVAPARRGVEAIGTRVIVGASSPGGFTEGRLARWALMRGVLLASGDWGTAQLDAGAHRQGWHVPDCSGRNRCGIGGRRRGSERSEVGHAHPVISAHPARDDAGGAYDAGHAAVHRDRAGTNHAIGDAAAHRPCARHWGRGRRSVRARFEKRPESDAGLAARSARLRRGRGRGRGSPPPRRATCLAGAAGSARVESGRGREPRFVATWRDRYGG